MKILQAWNKTNLPDKYCKALSDSSVQFPLPIEVVANNIIELLQIAKVWPNGRLWLLDAYAYKDEYLPYTELCNTIKEDGESFKGTICFSRLILSEVWENMGDDGHTEYKLMGYVLSEVTPEEIIRLRDFSFIQENTGTMEVWDKINGR